MDNYQHNNDQRNGRGGGDQNNHRNRNQNNSTLMVFLIATLVVVLINSAAGLAAHAGAADSVDYRVLLLFAGSALVISASAARWSAKLDPSTVRRWFAVVVLAVAAFVAVAAIVDPSTLG